MDYINAFFCGGFLCLIGQLLIDRTSLTPARILVLFVVSGVVLEGLGLYAPILEWGGAGATVPLSGFGRLLAKGVREGIQQDGVMGILSGGITAAAAGITAALFFGFVIALLCKPHSRS